MSTFATRPLLALLAAGIVPAIAFPASASRAVARTVSATSEQAIAQARAGARCSAPARLHDATALLSDAVCIGAVPATVVRFLRALPDTVLPEDRAALESRLREPQPFIAIRSRGTDPDYLVQTPVWWVRSIEGTVPGDTHYLVNGLPCAEAADHCRTLRTFHIDMHGRAVEDTHASPPEPSVGLDMPAYRRRRVGDVQADLGRLQRVPVIRWFLDIDPDRPLPARHPRQFDGGRRAHVAFWVWDGRRWRVQERVPRALWPCAEVSVRHAAACSANERRDPFVIP